MWKLIRVAILLLILATVAQTAWLDQKRATAWQDPLRVAIYPINADGSDATETYLRSLTQETFSPIAAYMDEEAARHGRKLSRSLDVVLAPKVSALPPAPPPHASQVEAIMWSLKMRYWAWKHGSISGFRPQVRLFVLYFDPQLKASLPHSTALQKGLVGVVNAFASQSMVGSNRVVITHELLHTLGATDKYEPGSNQPQYPDGFAEPAKQPLYPQTFAEIMGGRIPISETASQIPPALAATTIGPKTAAEIGWR